MNPFTLEGKNILVTGASSGIGKGIAVACSQMGARVFITARSEVKLQQTLSEMSGSDNRYFVADLTDEFQRENIVSDLPILDGVVHCAGIGSRVLCKNVKRKDIDSVFGINLYAPVLLQSTLLSQKKINKNSSIVFIASKGSETPSVGNAIYSASKGAIVSYAKVLALELASRGVRVNCVSPGIVWTDLIFKDGIDIGMLKDDEKRYPLKRYGTPEDIAHLVLYLLSEASSWMTGDNIEITGGGFGTLIT